MAATPGRVLPARSSREAPPPVEDGSNPAVEASPEPEPASQPPSAAAGGEPQIREVFLPDIGDFSDIPVIELLVAEGDRVDAEDGLITLESDKATMEVPSPSAGVIRELKVKIDDTVSEGDLVGVLEVTAAGDAPTEAAPAADVAEEAPAEPVPAAAAAAAEPAPAETAPAAESAGDTETTLEVRVPDIGDFEDVPVIEVLVAAGDHVKAEDGLITLESDKATMEVPSPADGVISEVRLKVDDTASEGDVVAVLEVSESAADEGAETAEPDERADEAEAEDPSGGPDEADAEKASDAEQPAAGAGESAAAPASGKQGDLWGIQPEAESGSEGPRPTGLAAVDPSQVPYASPAIRRFARELGVDRVERLADGALDRRLDLVGLIATGVDQATGQGGDPEVLDELGGLFVGGETVIPRLGDLDVAGHYRSAHRGKPLVEVGDESLQPLERLVGPVEITRRATDVGVTPADDGSMVESYMEEQLAKLGGTEWGF